MAVGQRHVRAAVHRILSGRRHASTKQARQHELGHAGMPRDESVARDASAHLDVVEAHPCAAGIELLFAQ